MARGRRPLLLVPSFAAVTLVLIAIASCRSPTQVTLDIRTHGFRCSELRRVTVAVAAEPPAAEAEMGSGFVAAEVTSCDSDQSVGTLVVTPERSTGAIVVAASYADKRCEPPKYAGCIVARRAFTFIDHTSLRLPITLEISCKDVPCETFSSCRAGQCVSSQAACSEQNEECTSDAEPVFLPDGGSVPSDAPVGPDGRVGETDAGPDKQDGSSSDGAQDAVTDVGTDVLIPPVDASSDVTNICPTMGGPQDCSKQTGVCCAMGVTYFCQAPPCTGGYPYYVCTGKGACGGGYCCERPPIDGGPPTYLSECLPACTTKTLCNSDADCRVGTCTGPKSGPSFTCSQN
jgi:hypothetical protein